MSKRLVERGGGERGVGKKFFPFCFGSKILCLLNMIANFEKSEKFLFMLFLKIIWKIIS
jgi:hypothetical protein